MSAFALTGDKYAAITTGRAAESTRRKETISEIENGGQDVILVRGCTRELVPDAHRQPKKGVLNER